MITLRSVQTPINRLLANTSLGTEEIERIKSAYEHAVRTLSLNDRSSDQLTEIIAKKIIEVDQSGIYTPAQISGLVIEDLGIA